MKSKTIEFDRYLDLNSLKKYLDTDIDIDIDAPTGSGKTTLLMKYFLNKKKKFVFVVPYVSNVLQLEKAYQINGVVGGVYPKREDYYITTVDSLFKIIKVLGNSVSDYTLIYDEYHNVNSHYSFKFKAIDYALKSISRFKNTIKITGTSFFLYDGSNLTLKFVSQNSYFSKRKLITKKQGFANNYINFIMSNGLNNGINVVISSSKRRLGLMYSFAKQNGLKAVYWTSSFKKSSESFKQSVQEQFITGEPQLVLATQLISDGINFNNENINSVLVDGIVDFYTTLQFVARFRKSRPIIYDIAYRRDYKFNFNNNFDWSLVNSKLSYKEVYELFRYNNFNRELLYQKLGGFELNSF